MKQVHRFIADFAGYFVITVGSLAIAVMEVSTHSCIVDAVTLFFNKHII